jgi:hypothetical protein
MKPLIFTLILIIAILAGLLVLSSAHEAECKHDLELKEAVLEGCMEAFKILHEGKNDRIHQ